MAEAKRRKALVEEVWCAYRGAGRTIFTRTRAGVSSGGLTFPRVALLRIIVTGGRTTSKDLADAMRVTTANLPGLLDKLEADGLVTRVRDRKDRRFVFVEATSRGERKLKELWRRAMLELADVFADWSDSDLRSLRDLLARLAPEGCESGPRRGLVTLAAERRRVE